MYLFDTFTNFLSGLGVPGRDKMTAFQYTKQVWTRDQLEAAYQSDWIARKAITIPAHDATREWRAWQAKQNQIELLEATEKRLGLQLKLQQALVKARLYGGACLLIGVDGDMASELDPETIGKDALKFIHVLAPHQLVVDELIKDISDPYYGQPSFYVLRDEKGQKPDAKIHPSRMVRLIGLDTPDPMSNYGWGDPLMQTINDAVSAAGTVAGSVAAMIGEAKFDVIKIPGLTEIFSTSEGTSRLVKRFSEANVAKSIINAVVLDGEEEWQRIGVDFSGMPEVLQMYLQIAAGACDIPVTRFLGMSPAGLNATGESDLANYYDRIHADQELRLTPALEKLDKAVQRSALGKFDPNIFYEWGILWQMDEKTKADVAKVKADAAMVDANSGLVPFEALVKGRCNQLIEDGIYPGLEDGIEKAIEEMESLDEEEAAALPPQLPPGAPPPKQLAPPSKVKASGMEGQTDALATMIEDALRQWNEEKHSRVEGGKEAGQFGSGRGTPGERNKRAVAAFSPKVKARNEKERQMAIRAQHLTAQGQQKEAAKAAEGEKKAEVTPTKAKKIATRDDFAKAKVRFRMPDTMVEEFVTKWNEKIGVNPEEFAKTFTGGLQDRVEMSMGMSGNEFQVTGIIKDDKGRTIGNFDRDIKPDKKEAYSAYFKLERAATGDDTGKRILGGNVEAYEAMGITTVRVTANIDVGGYAWAKYGYVPTAAAWSTLSSDLERKLDRETGEGGSSSRGRSSGETMEADSWDMLGSDAQEDTFRRWARDSRDEFLQHEISSWQDSGQPLEQAKRDLQGEFNGGDNDWALDELKRIRAERIESGEKDYPFNDEEILAALSIDDYESRYEDGRDDPEFTWDDAQLDASGANKTAGQLEMPGIEPPLYHKALDDDMRDEIIKALETEFNSKAESNAGDMDPPDYLGEQVEEYQQEYWDSKEDEEKLREAINYGLADIEIEPEEDDEEEPEMDLTEEEKEDPEIAELYDALRSGNPKSIWKIADSKLGKKLLLGSGWSGILDLKDKDSYARFKAYVGSVGKK